MARRKPQRDTETSEVSDSTPEDESTVEAAPEAAPEESVPEVPKGVTPAPETKPSPVHQAQQAIPFRTFYNLAGKKKDQLAGFAHYVKKQKLAPRSILEWREANEQFQKRPC